jgi:hypothetical protein
MRSYILVAGQTQIDLTAEKARRKSLGEIPSHVDQQRLAYVLLDDECIDVSIDPQKKLSPKQSCPFKASDSSIEPTRVQRLSTCTAANTVSSPLHNSPVTAQDTILCLLDRCIPVDTSHQSSQIITSL